MSVDLRTTQEYLNDKAGTVGLTKQQCLNILAGTVGMTAQDAALNYAGLNTRGTIQEAMEAKGGSSCAPSDDVVLSTQECIRRI